jgi:single-strand DNA-binding protein
MQVNDVIFAGYTGRDADVRTTQNGKEMASFSLCYSRKYGKDQEESTWVTVFVYGEWVRTAQQIKKGDNVVVHGQLRVSSYKDKQGIEKMSVSIIARTLGLILKDTMPSSTRSAPPPPEDHGMDIPF